MNKYGQNEGWFEGDGEADVVFCLDASNSMKSYFDGLKSHIISFLQDYEPKTGKRRKNSHFAKHPIIAFLRVCERGHDWLLSRFWFRQRPLLTH